MDDLVSNIALCINYEFSQVKFLQLALMHSSYANEQGKNTQNNERLEFLGDAVLELVISQEAYTRYPTIQEGQLTRIRSALVKESALARLARQQGLDKYILLGKGEEAQGGRARDALLADTLEALFGAIFLDAGFEDVRLVILDLFEEFWPQEAEVSVPKDYKSRLQEKTQHIFKERPKYSLLDAKGPEHDKIFEVAVTLPDDRVFTGIGSSLKKAEQAGARLALQALPIPE